MEGNASDRSLTIPELPTLEPGLTLVECEGDPRLVLQSLAVDKLLLEGGDAIWLGTERYCTTETLVDIAPSRRIGEDELPAWMAAVRERLEAVLRL